MSENLFYIKYRLFYTHCRLGAFPMIKVLSIALALTVFVIPSYASEANSFLAVSPSVLAANAHLTQSDTVLVHDYVMSQIATNNLTLDQFNGLTADQQRVVLVPGKAFTFSREIKRTVVPHRQAVPSQVINQIVVNKALPFAIVDQYAIDLPASITAELPELPSGYQRVLIGSKLVLLDANSVVLDATTIKL
jgi:hypothetical protein